MITDFTDRQDVYAVHPFLEAIDRSGAEKPVLLSVVLTSHMIKDEQYRTNILNWITSFPRIDGIYLIPDCERASKADPGRAVLKRSPGDVKGNARNRFRTHRRIPQQ
jgi:hypothetical protein